MKALPLFAVAILILSVFMGFVHFTENQAFSAIKQNWHQGISMDPAYDLAEMKIIPAMDIQSTWSDYSDRAYHNIILMGWLVLYGFVLFLLICLLLLPLFVWQIKKQAVKTNQLLEKLIKITESK